MLHVTILKCPYIPKVFIYNTRAVKMFIINLIVRQSSPPTGPKVGLHAQLIKINLQWQVNYYIYAERKQK